MVALDLGNHAVEHGIGMGLSGAHAHVFLAELLELGVEGNSLLHATRVSWPTALAKTGIWEERHAYKLFRERDLLQLHLVDCALGRAEQHSCGQQSTLHVGRWFGQSAGRIIMRVVAIEANKIRRRR